MSEDTITRIAPEPYVTKGTVAAHFGFTTRWVELRVAEGMPRHMFGIIPRFRISECEEWVASQRSAA